MAVNLRFVASVAALALATFTISGVAAYEVNVKKSKITITSVKDFTRCENETSMDDWCVDGLTAYIKSHPAEAFAAGKEVRLKMTHWVALRFFEKGVEKYTPAQCADEDVALAVVSGLALPDDYPAYKSALKVAGGRCWSALNPQLVKQIADSNSYYRDHTCALFKSKGATPVECASKVEGLEAASAK